MTYASAFLTDPAAVYRQIDVVGRTAMADGPALVQLLYEELIALIRVRGKPDNVRGSERPA